MTKKVIKNIIKEVIEIAKYNFTYLDYIVYKRILYTEPKSINALLKEDGKEYSTKYILNKESKKSKENQENKIKKTQEHDKFFKQIFKNKKETAIFINRYLELKETKNELKAEDIEECNTEFINENMEKLQSDILYKIKGTQSYILIEHQTTIDYRMPLRILEYCIEIMRKIEKQEQMNFRKMKYPTIYPIVLYTGKRKWKVETEIKNYEDNYLGIKGISFTNYKLLDINNYTEEELLKEEGIIAKAMLMEKAKNKEEIVEIVEKIAKQKMRKEDKEFLVKTIKGFLKNKIEVEKTEEIIKKINIKREESEMVIENLERIWDKSIREGRKNGIEIR